MESTDDISIADKNKTLGSGKFFSANEILSFKDPEDLFVIGAKAAIDREYKALLLMWHPDRNKDSLSTQVTAKIIELYRMALDKINAGLWERLHQTYFHTADNQIYGIDSIAKGNFELGKYFISNKNIAYVIDSEWSQLLKSGKLFLANLSFKNEWIKEEISKQIVPINFVEFCLKDKRSVMIVPKSIDMIRLKDVLIHYKGAIDPKAVAWIISSALNLCCFFHISGICHNDISLESLYISPEKHVAALYGGWWYAQRSGERLKSVPERTFKLMPSSQIKTKVASRNLNLILLRDVALDLLGGVFNARKIAPKPMINWLMLPPAKNALEDYDIWQKKILPDSFGERKFTPMNLTVSDVYTSN